MPKTPVNVSFAQLAEEGGSASALETMYSVVVGNGADPVQCPAGNVEGDQSLPSGASAMQAAIRYTGGAPVEDLVVHARFDDNGNFIPGKDISTDHVLVVWVHHAGSDDSHGVTWD